MHQKIPDKFILPRNALDRNPSYYSQCVYFQSKIEGYFQLRENEEL